MSEYLNTVEIEPAKPATKAVIWMHGLGADAHDFEPVVPMLGLPADHTVRFVFPNAPKQPVTINMGMVMPAWYDITGIDFDSRQDAKGIHASQAEIEKLIQREIDRGIAAEDILLAGFSQGGVIALQTGLRYSKPLAGIMALSTYLALDETLEAEASPANKNIPIFMAHGSYDPVIAMKYAEASRDKLKAAGYNLQWQSYPMEHQVAMEEIRDMGQWLIKALKLQ